MNDIVRKSDVYQEDRISRSNTQLDSASESEKRNEPITSNVPVCFFHVQFKRSC